MVIHISMWNEMRRNLISFKAQYTISPNITTVAYADDTTIISTHTNPHIA